MSSRPSRGGRASTPAPGIVVELIESESVVVQGSSVVTYRIQSETGWIKAMDWSDAVVEHGEPSPGTIWQRRISVRLLPGTRLERIVSQPRRQSRADAVDYLLGSRPLGQRRVIRTTMRLADNGRLVIEPRSRSQPAGR